MEAKVVQLLEESQIPDTNRVKAATLELRKTYYPHPESLIILFHILFEHPKNEIKHAASVECLRLVPKHWPSIPEIQKPEIREQLTAATLSEQNSLIRHSESRVIAAIANLDLQDGEWKNLPDVLFRIATSQQSQQREVATYILFSLLEAAGDALVPSFSQLFTVFAKTIGDPESADVRINTMLALSRVAMLIEPDEDEHKQNLAAFQGIFPSMVQVLKTAVDQDDDERIMQAFEVFQTLIGCESALIAPHFKNLVIFMLEIAGNTESSSDTRSQALSFLMQCVKYRRMKVQGITDMGQNLTLKAMQIATEIEESDDDDDEDITPARSALALLDLLASSLPPRQVIVPLLDALPQYVNSPQPALRRGGILALGMCVEGAPDFVATQLGMIIPLLLNLLNDPESSVRLAALHGVASLSDDLAEDMAKEHATIIPALLKNLDAATIKTSDKAAEAKNLSTIKAVCRALDTLMEGMESAVTASYTSELVPRLGRLIDHPDFKVKASAIGAMGSMAGAAEAGFMPYFETTMKALSEYVTIKHSEDELELRATVIDSMGSIASAVGAKAFQPYVEGLMQASEEALNLGHARLRETNFILWATMAKVYGTEFTPFLPGVVKGLMDSLTQEESDLEVELGEEAKDLIGTEVNLAGKKIKVVAESDNVEDVDIMEGSDDEDDDDWDDVMGVTGVALEKEISVEVLGDVLSHTGDNFIPYLEKAVEATTVLVDHPYEGIRKAAIATLWRTYACLWNLMEEHTGTKWQPGLPLKQAPSPELVKLGEVVSTATMALWGDEIDRAVVTDINRNVAATLKVCGPAILTHENMIEQVTTILGAMISRSHPCQLDIGDEEEIEDQGESAEYDWLVVDTAFDVLIGLATALGEQFGELWKIFEKPVMKYASSQEASERLTAVGTIAECTRGMGSSVTPYTSRILKLLTHRLSDEDSETKSNAAYAVGLLLLNSTDSAAYLPSYNTILQKLEPMLHTSEKPQVPATRILDNAAGCVCRMIMAHPDKVPLSDVLPVLLSSLPLKEDYEENKPIYDCLVGLYQQGEPITVQLLPQLTQVLKQVLSPPEEQLDAATRAKVSGMLNHVRNA